MAQIFLIGGWLLAILCIALLAKDLIKARRLTNPARAERRRRRLWLWRRRSVTQQPVIVEDPAVTDDVNIRPWIRPAGVVAFLLWEAFWISEIFERSSQTDRPLQLPYVFLLVVMIGIPAGAYYLSRKWLAPDPEDA